MKRFTRSDFLLPAFWTAWRRWTVWFICIGAIGLLGAIRAATDGELAFASLALLPVLAIAWIGGRRNGLLMAFLAAGMWVVGDIASARQFSAPWIPWANALTRLVMYSVVALLAAQVRLQFERENERATLDMLTGLQNRRAFLELGGGEVVRSKRYAHPMAVIFLDLDDFKQLNDTRGHATGDLALKATARALLGALRSTDRVARLGGDEFAIMIPETGFDAAAEAGKKIFNAVKTALGKFPPVGASVGVAWFGVADRSFPDMLKAADELMYEVKESGKDNVRWRRFGATSPPGTGA